MSLARILSFLVILAFTLVVGAYIYYSLQLKQSIPVSSEHSLLEITKGEPLNGVLNRLQASSVLSEKNVLIAKIYLKAEYYQGRHIAGQIKAGEFQLPETITIPALFELLMSNKQVRYSVTLIEGSTFEQALKVLHEQPKLTHLLSDQSPEQAMEQLPIDPRFKTFHPEGLIYPDTYQYLKGDTDISILERAHVRLVKVLDEEWKGRQPGLPLANEYDALILASIIEKETGKPSEREEIAGVFVRRLQKKMRLQTDPTVIYGLGSRYKGNITRKHLREMTPYNTYRINGLPPTPIALVGRAAIHAALNPAEGKTLYFVAKGDGSHQFSETIDEHNKAVRQYQLKRRSDYRSSHQATN